jgi:hypothetical protein
MRLMADVGTPSTAAHDEAARPQQPIRGRNRDGTDPKLGSEVANRRQPAPWPERPGMNQLFDRCRYFGPIRAFNPI